jgi:Flp pilus assembly protein TadB
VSLLASRFRTFRTPRLSVAALLLGLAVQTIARSRIQAAFAGSTVAVASLDSAINAATPSPSDTSGRNDERLRSLVAQKRDIEVKSQQATQFWLYASLLGNVFIFVAVVTGAQALFAHLRDGA